MNRIYKYFIVFILAACSSTPTQVSSQPTAAQTQPARPIITDTSIPPAVPTQAPTSFPTDLVLPTFTSIPPTPTLASPAILGDYLINPAIASFDSFDTLGDWSTSNSQAGILSNGIFVVTGQPGGLSSLTKNTRLAQGQGLIFDFQYNNRTQLQFIFEAGEPKTDSYRRLSVSGAGSPTAALTQGKNAIGTDRFTGNFLTKPGNWYGCMAGIGTQGHFVVIIWDKNNPTHLVKLQKNLGPQWDNLSWQFTAKVADKYMKLSLDNFSVLNFDEIKSPLK